MHFIGMNLETKTRTKRGRKSQPPFEWGARQETERHDYNWWEHQERPHRRSRDMKNSWKEASTAPSSGVWTQGRKTEDSLVLQKDALSCRNIIPGWFLSLYLRSCCYACESPEVLSLDLPLPCLMISFTPCPSGSQQAWPTSIKPQVVNIPYGH